MKDNEAQDGGSPQTSIEGSWQNHTPTESHTQTPSDETGSEQKSQPAAISHSPQQVVNADGVVLPYTKTQLQPIETWGPGIPDQEYTDITALFTDTETTSPDPSDVTPAEQTTAPSPDTKSGKSGSSTGSRGGVRVVQREPEEDVSTDEPDREPLGAISSYAKSSPEEPKENTKWTKQRATGRNLVETECPECGGDIRVETNDQYCADCGMVVADEQIDPGPEWRAFDARQKENRSRVGGPVKKNIHDKGLSTVIGADNTDAHGNPLSSRMKKRMNRLRKWDSRFKVKNTKERNLRQAFGEIHGISSEMDLPDYVEETACTVYRRALDEELLPGRSIEAIATASVYIAMRQAGIPKTIDHLTDYSRVKESRVTGAYSYIGKELGLQIEPPKVKEYLSRVASELEVTTKTERKAEGLLQNSVDQNLHSGKAPSGMAAAAVYAATMLTRCDRVTQEAAAKAGDVCELTIRTRHRELLEAVGRDYEEISPPSPSEVEENRNKPEETTTGSGGAETSSAQSASVTSD